MIKVPMNTLSVEALQGVIDAYVLREGTDYGHRDYSLEEKRAAVERQLRRAEAEIWFDPQDGTTEIRPVAARCRAAAGPHSDRRAPGDA